jgi:transcriptional regulator with XRE-family HTH domain
MNRDGNVIGRVVAKLRYHRAWTQDQLVAKLQLLGCYMTRDILASIETQRSPVTDKQIEFFAEVFGVDVWDLFPPKRHFSGQIVGLLTRIVTRRRVGSADGGEERVEPQTPTSLAGLVKK